MVASSPPSYSLRHRMTALLCVFAALLSVLLCYLFRMQVFDYQNYQRRVLEQITVGAALKAERGEILDRNGNVLATNRTVWRIWVSPVDVRQKSREENRDYASILAAELSALLELDAEKVRAKLSKTGTLDQTLLRGCSRETAEKVLQYIGDRGYGRNSAVLSPQHPCRPYHRFYRQRQSGVVWFRGLL